METVRYLKFQQYPIRHGKNRGKNRWRIKAIVDGNQVAVFRISGSPATIVRKGSAEDRIRDLLSRLRAGLYDDVEVNLKNRNSKFHD